MSNLQFDSNSPTPVAAFLSVASKIAGLALLARFFNIIFFSLSNEWHLILEILAIFSMILGNLVAITQTSMKRMLAYSSISQIGYLMIGIITGEFNGYASMIVYLLFYIFMNLGAFACIILFGLRTGTDNIRDYSGLILKDPLLTFSFALCLLSLGGIPPLSGFFGKLYLFWCAWKNGLYFLVFIGLFTSIISIYYYLKIVKILYSYGEEENHDYVAAYAGNKKALNSNSEVQTEVVIENNYLSNVHSFLISILTLAILLFIIKPSFILNSTQLLSLSLFYW